MNHKLKCGVQEKKGGCLVPLIKLEVLPLYHRETIPEDYLDLLGHMNIRWYMALFDKAAWNFFGSHGMSQDYVLEKKSGEFALKNFIQYFAEVRAGQTIAIRTRLLGRSDKRVHLMHFMINETTEQLASILEVLSTHADLTLRRAAPIPTEIAEKFDEKIKQDKMLDWKAPVCGVIHP